MIKYTEEGDSCLAGLGLGGAAILLEGFVLVCKPSRLAKLPVLAAMGRLEGA